MHRETEDQEEALAMQRRIISAMSDEQRLKMVLDMSELVRELNMAGLRMRFPEASEAELVEKYIRYQRDQSRSDGGKSP